MTRRFQFDLKTLFWLIAVVATFFGGARWQLYRDERDHELWNVAIERLLLEALHEAKAGDAGKARVDKSTN